MSETRCRGLPVGVESGFGIRCRGGVPCNPSFVGWWGGGGRGVLGVLEMDGGIGHMALLGGTMAAGGAVGTVRGCAVLGWGSLQPLWGRGYGSVIHDGDALVPA